MTGKQDWIIITGAREHNLKNIEVRFPRNQLTVVTGVSGSGKSTLMFNILCQEGERKFIRATGRVPDNVERPDYDDILGLSPIISVNQHHHNYSPRSTVGTYSEAYTYLRLLYTAIGERPCPSCLSTIAYADLRSAPTSPAGEAAAGTECYPCPSCGTPVENITMAHFSFNTEQGACPACMGLGEQVEPVIDAILRPDLSIQEGGIQVWKKGFIWHFGPLLVRAAKYYNLPFGEEDLKRPIGELPEIVRHLLLYGTDDLRIRNLRPDAPAPSNMKEGKYEGAINSLMRRYYEEAGDDADEELATFLRPAACPACQGTRLKPSSLEVTVNGTPIHHLLRISIRDLLTWLNELPHALEPRYVEAVRPILAELTDRAQSLVDTGLGYLTLDRGFSTLSGGEAQRMRLSSLLNSNLTGMVCVLDEPTAGLHPQDTDSLVAAMQKLRALGNTIIVVEHDLDVIKQADYVVDIGPAAGEHGGQAVFQGTVDELLQHPVSVTAKCLREVGAALKRDVRPWTHAIALPEACTHNLQRISVDIPLGVLTAVTGVSGSGKSTLILEELLERLPVLSGSEQIQHTVVVDQHAMGKMARSNAATYTKVFDHIREHYRLLAKREGMKLKASDFSFNVAGGRCEACKGTGQLKLQMHFMPARYLTCPTCQGKRYNETILGITYRVRHIADVLDMSIAEARDLFQDIPDIVRILDCLVDIGLGYLPLGQPANTFSGGEAQRVKLASELAGTRRQHTLYILDEPSIGLHDSDTGKLMNVLDRLVDKGNTVIVIEHHLQLIRQADWIIELGPKGGNEGGEVIAEGTPQFLLSHPGSILKRYL
ncbi:excinuclease ABC subunit UvrA [Paenibacillus apiarius]|uniref:UvrABC system protein A n=1 Tax=Paenibacillus apiarius TaxID=46240 RepID=A0ABT4DWU1_9BACL|nr:excinuclease ABC subunit UvrA [Paenibacillus apiarius]MCY9515008.1 excinuclease ABC subunit UvrA [Paenibacillus apiarius]MCY9520558.1 excinuclease ABC subunit UvrA [Paenibacillus apiarius]MCY9552135.1 excinuclease ABC subunit UvrA [Paenibacillus apiarius]MCY9561078.1 excinuclease ABC subunit UvrA [Paenibacillus apiarius]MCY9686281.1 excinuclease ABC subunit UvrA [Paenibacillus apiarius]